jgi:tripartite-type tricarboxylate transporter receptor subunit TctC
MKLARRRFVQLAASAATLPAVPRIASAQAYPAKPIHLIVAFAPAGARSSSSPERSRTRPS